MAKTKQPRTIKCTCSWCGARERSKPLPTKAVKSGAGLAPMQVYGLPDGWLRLPDAARGDSVRCRNCKPHFRVELKVSVETDELPTDADVREWAAELFVGSDLGDVEVVGVELVEAK